MIYNASRISGVFSYTQFPNYVLTSARGVGKTYTVQDELMDEVKAHRYISLIRESQVEVEDMLHGGFWDPNLLNNHAFARKHDFTVKGNMLLCDGVVIGTAIALTTYANLRNSGKRYGSLEYADKKTRARLEKELTNAERIARAAGKMNTTFFDEFEPLIPKLAPTARTEAYLHVCENLFRMRDNVRAILCANLETPASPFLDMFNFDTTQGVTYGIRKSYTRDKTHRPLAVWAHLEPNTEWLAARGESYVGKILAGTDGGEIFKTGAPTELQGVKIGQTPGTTKCIICNLSDGREEVTVFKTSTDDMYITERTKNKTFPTFTYSPAAISEKVLPIPPAYIKFIRTRWGKGTTRFDAYGTFDRFTRLAKIKR